MIECQSSNEYKSFAVGDRIECKILLITKDSDRMWIELTRNSKHMAKLKGLDEEVVKATPNTLEELKVGQ